MSKSSENITIQVVEFDKLLAQPSIAILGKRRTGKTTWALYIAQFLALNCDRFMVFCGNKENKIEWSKIIPPLYVQLKSVEKLKTIIAYQDEKCARFKQLHPDTPLPKRLTLTLFIDDCGSDKSFMHHKIMRDLLSNGRHYGISVVILAQYLNQMHSENRDQLDYVGVLYTANQKNIKKLFVEYASSTDEKLFTFLIKSLTINYGMCWLDNTKTPEHVTDHVYHMEKLQWPCPLKKIGSEAYWNYSNRHYHNSTPGQTKHNTSVTVSVDTDGEDDVNIKPNNHKFMYIDKKGSITVIKEKQKTD